MIQGHVQAKDAEHHAVVVSHSWITANEVWIKLRGIDAWTPLKNEIDCARIALTRRTQ